MQGVSDRGLGRILIMIGGAGNGIGLLLEDPGRFYPLLMQVLKRYPFICGVDLDIEEQVRLQSVQSFIEKIRGDTPKDFIITMSPVASSLMGDSPGLGGFSYKALRESVEGQMVDWFNVQYYGCFDEQTWDMIINNGLNPTELVFVMDGDEYTTESAVSAFLRLKSFTDHPGPPLWEFGDTSAPPVTWGGACFVVRMVKAVCDISVLTDMIHRVAWKGHEGAMGIE